MDRDFATERFAKVLLEILEKHADELLKIIEECERQDAAKKESE